MAAFVSATINETAAGYFASLEPVGSGWLMPPIPSMSTLM